MTEREIVIYTTGPCPYCRFAKRLLEDKRVAFREVDVEDDDETRAWLRTATGRTTVPQIFIGDVAIGGYDELAALDRSGRLDGLLGSPCFARDAVTDAG